jgi:hypothetical protein
VVLDAAVVASIVRAQRLAARNVEPEAQVREEVVEEMMPKK